MVLASSHFDQVWGICDLQLAKHIVSHRSSWVTEMCLHVSGYQTCDLKYKSLIIALEKVARAN